MNLKYIIWWFYLVDNQQQMLNTLYLESLPESFDQYHIYAAWSLNVLASNYIVKNIV